MHDWFQACLLGSHTTVALYLQLCCCLKKSLNFTELNWNFGILETIESYFWCLAKLTLQNVQLYNYNSLKQNWSTFWFMRSVLTVFLFHQLINTKQNIIMLYLPQCLHRGFNKLKVDNLSAVLYSANDMRLEQRPVPEPQHNQVKQFKGTVSRDLYPLFPLIRHP